MVQVACYKICMVKLNRTQSDDDDDAAETLDSEEAIVRSVMRDSSQGSLDRRCTVYWATAWHVVLSLVGVETVLTSHMTGRKVLSPQRNCASTGGHVLWVYAPPASLLFCRNHWSRPKPVAEPWREFGTQALSCRSYLTMRVPLARQTAWSAF